MDRLRSNAEGTLDEEWNEELGYSKCDHQNKDTSDSRTEHSGKTMHTSYGDMEVAIPRNHNGEHEPRLIKKYHNNVIQDMEEKISLYVCKRHDNRIRFTEMINLSNGPQTLYLSGFEGAFSEWENLFQKPGQDIDLLDPVM